MDELTTVLAALGGVGTLAGVATALVMLRRRRGARARLYFSMRTSERTDTTRSDEPPPFPRKKDDPP